MCVPSHLVLCNPAFLVPVTSQDKLRGCCRKGIWHKNGWDDGGGGTDSPDRVASSRTVGASVPSCTIKTRRWHLSPRGTWGDKWVLGSSGQRAVKWLLLLLLLCSLLLYVRIYLERGRHLWYQPNLMLSHLSYHCLHLHYPIVSTTTLPVYYVFELALGYAGASPYGLLLHILMETAMDHQDTG